MSASGRIRVIGLAPEVLDLDRKPHGRGRHDGVPSYGASPVFTKTSENFSHGLNERTPFSNLPPAID